MITFCLAEGALSDKAQGRPQLDFTYIGRSPRGLDLRVYYFKVARLM